MSVGETVVKTDNGAMCLVKSLIVFCFAFLL